MSRLIHKLAPRYTDIPGYLDAARAPATPEELAKANSIRAIFCKPGANAAYMADAVRAFRLLKGAGAYLEIGTEDKGNLAYVSSLLSSQALIIDMDIERSEAQQRKLIAAVPATQKLHFVTGSSFEKSTIEKVAAILGETRLDAIFIDGNHSRNIVLADFNNYAQFLKEDGLVFIHDVYWEGDRSTHGSVPALEWIDRTYPTYVVMEDRPVHRYLPFQFDTVTWGCFGITRLSS